MSDECVCKGGEDEGLVQAEWGIQKAKVCIWKREKKKKKVTDLELKSLIKKSICLSEYFVFISRRNSGKPSWRFILPSPSQ